MVLFRRLLGEVLRSRRIEQGRTLRQLCADASVSLGYMSEIERGHKEASSELLAAICSALDAPLSEILSEVAYAVALEEAAMAGEVLRAKSGAIPALVHTHPTETIREAIDILREYGVSQMPVVKAEPPVMSGEVAGSVSERALCGGWLCGGGRAGARRD